jgi:kynurenine formamidase
MVKIAFVVAAAALTTAPLVTPAKAQGVKIAQVDMQTGLHIDDPAHYSRDRRRYDSNATVGVGPGGVTIGPRQRCRMETTTIERGDGRRITRRKRVCD